MNINSTVSPNLIRIVKTEPGVEHFDHLNSKLSHELRQQKQVYEEEIHRLQKVHDEQVHRLCSELEQSSLLIHQFKSELDTMRLAVSFKDKQLRNRANEQDLPMKNTELIAENTKLKKQLEIATNQYQILFHEMQDARQYVLNMIARLD